MPKDMEFSLQFGASSIHQYCEQWLICFEKARAFGLQFNLIFKKKVANRELISLNLFKCAFVIVKIRDRIFWN